MKSNKEIALWRDTDVEDWSEDAARCPDSDTADWFDRKDDDLGPVIMAPAQFTLNVSGFSGIKTFPNLLIDRRALISEMSGDRDWQFQ